MKKALLVHLYNKYPGHIVQDNGSNISVHAEAENAPMKLVMQVKLVASGAYECAQKESGAKEALDMSPIVRDARVFKLMKDGSIGRDELADEREKLAARYMKEFGKIPTEEDYKGGMRLKEVVTESAPSGQA